MEDRAPSMLKSTIIGGALAGALAGLPYVDMVNVCTCCSLVVLGGFLASLLYSRECRAAGQPFRPATGAVVGLIAGAFYAVTVTIVSSVMTTLIGQPALTALLEWLQEMMQASPDVPPDALDQIETALAELREERSLSVWKLITGLFTAVLVGAIFSTIGGLIGGAVFKVEPPPPRPAEPTFESPPPPGV